MNIKSKNKDIKDIVLERLKTFPSGKKISIGSYGSFSKQEIIGHVKKNDKLGKMVTKVHVEYLKSLKKGVFFKDE